MPHVLLVDDDQSFTPALSEYIQQQGLTVSTAHNLVEARASMAQARPDLLLLDITLPDGNGLDLLDGLQSRTRVVVLTGYPSIDTAVHGLRANVDDYLTKPIDLNRLSDWLTGSAGARVAGFDGVRQLESRQVRAVYWRISAYAEKLSNDRDRGVGGRHGDAQRRKRHGQGSGGELHPHAQRTHRAANAGAQLWCSAGKSDR